MKNTGIHTRRKEKCCAAQTQRDGVLQDMRKLGVKEIVEGFQGQGILEDNSSGS
jgi:hypothetical protein